jgi:hypothetical protein
MKKKYKKKKANTIVFFLVFLLFFLIIVFNSVKIILKSKADFEINSNISRPSFSGLNFYYGDLHTHSGYSPDSFGAPEDVYDLAKTGKNDFFSITDHDEAFIYNPYLCLEGVNNSLAGTPQFICKPDKKINIGTKQKWENLKKVAREKNIENSFIALYGYEWTHSDGHVNIINAPTFVNFGYSLGNLYGGLANHPDKSSLIAQFNHPQGSNFNNFNLDVRLTDIFSLIETNNFSSKYPVALNKGWKVGAVGYGDSHNYLEGGSRRYGIVSQNLTTESVLSALKNRNTFAVIDGRTFNDIFPLALALKINNTLMGGNVFFNGSVHYEIYVKDSIKNIDKVRLIYGGNYGAGTYLAKEFTNLGNEALLSGDFSNFSFSDPKRAKYMYIEVYQKNNLDQIVLSGISSPVWIDYSTSQVIPSAYPTSILSPTAFLSPPPTLVPTVIPEISCSGGCYGSKTNCTTNCKAPCIKLSENQTKNMCGWSSGTAYRCCK